MQDVQPIVDRDVVIRVLRFEAGFRAPQAGGLYRLETPIAVIDRGVQPARWRPVVDPALAAGVVAALLSAIRIVRRLRRFRMSKAQRR